MSSCVIIVELLKNLYGNPRPFWKDVDLFIVCEGGFGNPSGHSMASTGIFLALWSTIFDDSKMSSKINHNNNNPEDKNNKNNYTIFKYICLFLSIIMIILIIFSRLYLAAHSLNQVLYGSSLGLSLYLIYYKILELHIIKIGEFYNYFIKKLTISINYVILSLFFIIGLSIYFLKENETKPYEELLSKKCPKLKLYKKFNENGLYGGMVIFIFLGSYTSIIILLRTLINKDDFQYELYDKKEKNVRLLGKLYAINSWNRLDLLRRLYVLLIFIACCLPISFNLLIPSTSKLWIIYLFKTAIPFFLMGLLAFGLTIYFTFKFKLSKLEYEFNDEDYQNELADNDGDKSNHMLDDMDYKKIEIKTDYNKI
jgi:hypothetical protein